jgi:bifunctional non-homologous end joining protein LigD
LRDAWLDGEVVALRPDGVSSFEALQQALSEERDRDLIYHLFDLLHLDGTDLGVLPLTERKAELAALLADPPPGLRYSDHIEGAGEEFYRHACELALEGIISKRASAPYRSGRGRDWLKVKCLQRQEFVIGGYTDPAGSRASFGALLLGVYEDRRLVYAGRVGTGFSERTLRDLYARLQPLATAKPPFERLPPVEARAKGNHWVRPELVAEVAFGNWTAEGVLRHPSFQGLREDKAAREVRREQPARNAPAAQPQAPTARRVPRTRAGEPVRVAGVALSNPDKPLYPVQGFTKLDLARYYEAVAEHLLPGLAGRLLTLVRCPDGRHKDCFYQKHAAESVPPEVRRVPLDEKGKRVTYLAVDALPGVIGLVQMGVLEIHAWGSRTDRLEHPDVLVFDLDPDEGLAWEQVLAAARTVRARLEDLGLACFARTTGGKGLHVVVPLIRRHEWDEAKAFAKALADDVVRAEPRRYTARLAKSARTDKVFIDYLRNTRGATAVASYSTRARAGATVATPVAWDELDSDLRPDQFTLQNIPARLAALRSDPWEGYAKVRQSITKAMKRELGMK